MVAALLDVAGQHHALFLAFPVTIRHRRRRAPNSSMPDPVRTVLAGVFCVRVCVSDVFGVMNSILHFQPDHFWDNKLYPKMQCE